MTLTNRTTEFGLVGLGAMGGGMAVCLVRAGYTVSGFDPDVAAQDCARARGVDVKHELADLLEAVDVVVICLATPTALAQTYAAISENPAPHPQLVIETSTIAPDRARDLSAISRASGRRHLEACMIGLGKDAAAGELYHFVGGEVGDIEAARPFLDATGRGFVHLGTIGSGAAAKVLNNAIGNATILALTEAIVASEVMGLESHAFVRAVTEAKGAGMSVVFERHARWATSSEAQPPSPLNRKDMLEWGRLVGVKVNEYPILAETLRAFTEMPKTLGPVGAHAEIIRSRMAKDRG